MWIVYVAITIIIVFVCLYFFDDVKFYYYQKKLLSSDKSTVITNEDLLHLPKQIQQYLQVVGVVGKEFPKGMHLKISGEMKPSRNVDFAKAKAQQTSIFAPYSRYFYMQLKMRGVKVKGLHVFQDAKAIMKIKVLGIFRVVNGKGKEMDQAETVTVFNDMCLLAPHALVKADVSYEEIDDYTLKATFTNEGIRVSARLSFDDEGKLINFVSNDRYFSQDGEEQLSVPWATPIYEYKEQHGFYLPYKGEATWLFDDEDFTYFTLILDDIRYIS